MKVIMSTSLILYDSHAVMCATHFVTHSNDGGLESSLMHGFGTGIGRLHTRHHMYFFRRILSNLNTPCDRPDLTEPQVISVCHSI
jgi:hypothetical protein